MHFRVLAHAMCMDVKGRQICRYNEGASAGGGGTRAEKDQEEEGGGPSWFDTLKPN